MILVIFLIFTIRLATYYHMCIKTQIKRILSKTSQCLFKKLTNLQNILTLTYIFDGDIYQNLIKNKKIQDNDNKFLLNTDGISLCEKSQLSIWPVLLVINESRLNRDSAY